MGSESTTICLIIIFIIFSSLTNVGSDFYDPEPLDALFLFYANQTLAKHKGTQQKVTLPSNFSGMGISTTRTRAGRLWASGINLSSIKIPPKVQTSFVVKRVVIVSYTLGNWSSIYYNIPGYILVSPILGFTVYDYSNLTISTDKMMNLNSSEEPMSVHFPALRTNVSEPICVKIEAGGSYVFENMTIRNVCLTRKSGRFSVVVPAESVARKIEESIWRWWVLGFTAGAVGLLIVAFLAVKVPELLSIMRIKVMETESDTAGALRTFWVRVHRVPSASTIRTQPVVVHDYVS